MKHMIAALLALACLETEAGAHQNYTGMKDPVTGNSCCGGHDCAPIPAEWAYETNGGYRLVLNLNQTLTVNPNSTAGIAAFVPQARIIPSWDSDFHLCIYSADRSAPRDGVLCLMVPLSM